MFGERLKELREEKGMTQEDLGNMLNVTKQAVHAYENGTNQPSMESLVKIADFFLVSLDYLFCRTKVKTNISIRSNKEKIISEIKKVIDSHY